jgi:hypothetical protein
MTQPASAPGARAWTLAPTFLVRRTSLPLELLRDLAVPSGRRAAADESVAEAELERTRRRLYDVAGTARFQELLFLASPDMQRAAAPERLARCRDRPRSADVRRLERRLLAYLQRFCTRQDAAGAVDEGRFDPARPEPLRLRRLPAGMAPARRFTLSRWAAEALARVLAADPRLGRHLPLHLAPGIAVTAGGELLVAADGRPLGVAPDGVRLVPVLDGRATEARLRRALDPSAAAALSDLRSRGLAVPRLELPADCPDPLHWLAAESAHWLAGQPGWERWSEALARLDSAVTAVAGRAWPGRADSLRELERQFEELTGRPARRGPGEPFADRLAVREQRRGDVEECLMGGSLPRTIAERLSLGLTLGASYGQLVREVCAERAVAVLQAMGGHREQPYARFLRTLDREVTAASCLEDPRLQAFRRKLVRLAIARDVEGTARLRPEDVADLLRFAPPGTSVAADVVVAARASEDIAAGRFDLVLDRLEQVRRGGDRPAADLWVRLDGGRLQLWSRSRETEALPPAAGQGSVAGWLFGPPPVLLPELTPSDRLPRVRVGGAVLWRRTWRLERDEFEDRATPAALLARADQVRRRRGLPARGVVRLSSGWAPFFVDTNSILFLELLLAMTKREPAFDFVELLPQPDRWWLTDLDGTYGCSLSVTLTQQAPSVAAAWSAAQAG